MLQQIFARLQFANPSIIILTTLFCLPFVIAPIAGNPFEAPKVYAAEVFIEIVALFIFVTRWQTFRILWVEQRTFCLLLSAFFLLVLFRFALSPSNMAFWGNSIRMQGTFLFIHMLVFSSLVAVTGYRPPPHWLVLAAAIALLLTTLFFGKNSSLRFYGTLGEPNALGSITIIFLAFAIGVLRSWQRVISAGLLITIVLLSQSHAAGLALVLFGLFLGLRRFVSNKIALLICLGFIVIALVTSYGVEQYTAKNLVTSPMWQENRSDIWQSAIVAGYEKPFIGWGVGEFTKGMQDAAWRMHNSVRFATVDDAHNLFLAQWTMFGLPGLLLITSLVFITLQRLLIIRKTELILAFLGALTISAFNPLSVSALAFFWWLIGAAAAITCG